MSLNQNRVPVTFWIIAGIALLWNLMGLSAFVSDMMLTPENIAAMPEPQKSLYESSPGWLKIFYGAATISGVLASIGLLMRKNWAKILFFISLIAVIIQLAYQFLFMNILETMGSSVALPIMVLLIAVFLWYFSKKSSFRGWLS